MVQDFRFSLRMLRRNPLFAAVAILTLASGIGATTLIFSLADALIYHAFPYRDAGRITLSYIHELRPGGYSGITEFSLASFAEYGRANRTLEDILGFNLTGIAYRSTEGMQQIHGAWVTQNAFAFLGVSPLYGRAPAAEDAGACVVSYRFWQEQLHSDPNAVGRTLTLNGQRRTIAGVMPPRFEFLGASIWFPLRSGNVPEQPSYLQALGRLKPGIRLQAATADFDAIERRLAEAYPREYPDKRFRVSLRTLPDEAVGNFKTVVYTLFAAVALLLLIACSNVANLLLVRATAREREMAIRAAVGATRWRLVRQLLMESGILAAAAGVFGCLLAKFGIAEMAHLIPPGAVPGEAVIALQPLGLAFAFGVTLAATLLCGLAPALQTTRVRRDDPRQGRLRAALVIAEVALSLVLLVGAGLMTRTFFALTHVDLGFDSANLLHARMTLPGGRYQTAGEQTSFIRQVVAQVGSLPGVASATLSLEDTAISGGTHVEFDIPGQGHGETWDAALGVCDETYFRTMGRTIVHGAAMAAGDIDTVRHGTIVNQAFVRTYFPHQDPLGRKLHFHLERWRDAPDDPNFEITGVVSDARNQGLRDAVRPQIFASYTAFHVPPVGIMVRTRVAPLALVEGIRRRVWAVDPDVALTRVGTVEGSIGETFYAEPRFGLVATGGFASIGLALVVVGVFSVMAYSVATRTHEIGIRMALGAQPAQVLGMVLRKGLALMGAGVALGLVVSLSLTRLIASQLWGVAPDDPGTLAAVSFAVMAAGAVACFIPARRAARVDPARALVQ